MTADVRRLARNQNVDVSLDGVSWLNLRARTDNNSSFSPNKVDSTDVDTDGFMTRTITLQDGTIVVKYNSLINGGVTNPSHDLVEACEGQFDENTFLFVRVYDNDGGKRGWTGLALCEVAFTKTAVPDLREVTATFTWQGKPTKMSTGDITAALADASLPTITAASPAAATATSLLTIIGQHFTGTVGASHVTIGGTNATKYTVVSDSVIVAVVPAGSAGEADIVVTNVSGASAAFPYIRGA